MPYMFYQRTFLQRIIHMLLYFPSSRGRPIDYVMQFQMRESNINDLGDDIKGKPNAVIGKAEDVPKDVDIVIFALPSFTHEMYLKALKPYLKQGGTIGAVS